MNQLWVEKYRPSSLDGYVFMNDDQRLQVEYWVNTKKVPNLLISGVQGTGKTTLVKIIINAMGIHEYDLLQINASRERGIDIAREKIKTFSQTMPYGDMKVVFLDEVDYATPDFQAALRGAMEEYNQTVRFFMTCNYPHKVISALHSRCQGFHIDKLNIDEYMVRIATILSEEQIDVELETLDIFVSATYPDLRKCINLCQQNSTSGKLVSSSTQKSTALDFRLSLVDLIKHGKIREGRQLICSQARPEDMDEIFRWCYDNLSLWSESEDGQDSAILIIRKALVNHTMCADAEINLAAMFVELSQINSNLV